MAMRIVNILGQPAHHRTLTPAATTCVIDRNGFVPVAWRSSCGGFWPCRTSLRQSPMRCCAMASAQIPPLSSMDADCMEVMRRLREPETLKNCLGVSLTEEEQRSLIRCLDSARLGVDTCLVDGLEALRDHLISYIEAVAISQSDDLELVEGAMLLVEQLSLEVTASTAGSGLSSSLSTVSGRVYGGTTTYASVPAAASLVMPSSLSTSSSGSGEGPLEEGPEPELHEEERFSGQWQVLVTTGGGWPYGRLQYVPVIELLEISEDGGHFRLESKAGPLYMFASGEVTWRTGYGNHLHYHASNFRLELLGASLSLPPPAPDNDLCVFALTPTAAIARSALGGMQLLSRPT